MKSDTQHSMEKYLHVVERALEGSGLSWTLCRPHKVFSRSWQPEKAQKWMRFIDKFVIFPVWLRLQIAFKRGNQRNIVHLLDQGNALYLYALNGCNTLVTCHDFIAIRSAMGLGENKKPSVVQHAILRSLTKARSYIFVSSATRTTALELLGPRSSISPVILNPIDSDNVGQQSISPTPMAYSPFLLHVGNSAWYKNRPGLFKIYAELRKLLPQPPALHLYGEPLQEHEHTLLADLELQPHVTCHPRASNEAILLAYHQAAALIFPSLEEGFGWPPLEAMACGCPVFASNRPPLTEIGGDAAEYIDPEKPAQAAAFIASRLQLGEPWRQERAEAGRARAAEFNMKRFTSEMISAYESVLNGPLL